MNRCSRAILSIALVSLAYAHAALAQHDPNAEASAGRLIEQLGSGSYAQRVHATEQLIAIGPQAKNALLQAAKGDDFEIAVRARNLLDILNELLFAGVDVELTASQTRIAWSDAITLELRCRNTSDYPARLPFDSAAEPNPERERAGPRKTHTDAQDRLAQVSALLDLSDFLVVTAPDGRTIQLHVDDIGVDPQLTEAVNRRVDNPPTTALPPHAARVYRFQRFNRGWARYRLLRRGAYRVQFVYQPQWDDPEMQEAGIGRVTGKPVTITIAQPAPQNVCRGTREADLTITRLGDEYVATLTNLTDVPVWVNLNIAPGQTAPFSALRWSVEHAGQTDELIRGCAPAVTVFSRERLRQVAPGERIELGRMNRASVASHTDCEVSAAYTNMTSRAWQIQNTAGLAAQRNTPQTLKAPLPDRMLTTALRARAPCPPASPSE